MIIYTITKYLVRAGAELFFSKHHIQNFKDLETKGPLIVCANHASAHFDGILIMIFARRKFHVLVRADIFKKPWLAAILAKFNLVPIYRIRDGIGNMDKNDATFQQCADILANNGAIIIFPEANCVMERSVRKLHKGAAKIGFMTEEKHQFKLGIKFACVGIAQERLDKPGGRLYLTASKPFALTDYYQTYQENNQRAYNEVTQRIDQDLRSVLPVVNEYADEQLFEELIEQGNVRDDFKAWQHIAKSINEAEPELKEMLKVTLHDFHQNLQAKGVDIKTLRRFKNTPRYKRWLIIASKVIDLAAMFPFFIVGFLLNYWPFRLPERLAHQIFKEEKMYRNGTHLVASILLFLIGYGIYGIVFLAFGANLITTLVTLVFIAACGIVSYYYRRRFFEFWHAMRFELAGTEQQRTWRNQFEILNKEFALWLK